MNSRVIPLPGAARPESAELLPAAPRTPADTGLPQQMLGELLLKVMYQHGLTHVQELATHLKLPVAVLEALFTQLRRDALVEVRRRGALDGDVIYDLTQAGRTRGAEALLRNLYCGPAPVPLEAYAARVQAQSVGHMGVTQQQLREVLADVVIADDVRDQFGAAMNSRRAIMVYGPAGSGKTYPVSYTHLTLPTKIL